MLFDQIEKNLWKGKLTNVLIQFCFLRLSKYFCALELPSFRCSETGISRASRLSHLTSAAVKNFPYFIFNLKFQILINFLWQMLDFCLGCSNKKCWVWFLALIFLLPTFLCFWGNPYQAIQPVKTTILDRWKIAFNWKLASDCLFSVFPHYSWIFDSGTLINIVSAGIFD